MECISCKYFVQPKYFVAKYFANLVAELGGWNQHLTVWWGWLQGNKQHSQVCLKRFPCPYLSLPSCFGRWTEEIVQDRNFIAEENVFLLQDILFQQWRYLITKQCLVILPNLALHLHCTCFIQIFIGHYQLQLLLRDLWSTEQLSKCREPHLADCPGNR